MGSTFKKIEIVGTSAESYDKAIENAIASASKTLEGLSWFEVIEQRGSISGNKPGEYQVTLRIAFKIKED